MERSGARTDLLHVLLYDAFSRHIKNILCDGFTFCFLLSLYFIILYLGIKISSLNTYLLVNNYPLLK